MKIIKFILIGRCVILSALLAILPSCYTTSLHPLFTEEDLVDDPNLNGEWGSSEGGKLIFEEMGTLKDRFYRWTMYDDKGKEHSNFVARLVNVQGHTFLDLSPIVSSGKFSTSDSLLISPHFFMLVRQIQPTLQIAYLDEKWLEKYLTENAEAPQHEKTNSGYVLTAPTEELQTFLLKCAATEGAFKPDIEFSRLPKKDRETVINPFTDQSGGGSEVSESTVAAAANDSGKLTDAETKALAAIQAAFTPGVRYSRRLDIDWKALESAANKGNPEAMFHWGRIHDVEMGISADLEVSMRYYQMAADAGNAWAQNTMGWAYYEGLGKRKDVSKAIHWWRLAADQGNASAQINIGKLYLTGEGVEKNEVTAFTYFQKSAYQGDRDGQLILGHCYHSGQGCTKDLAKSAYWFERAALQEQPAAQNIIGVLYLRGIGVEKSPSNALRFFKGAADNGDSSGQNNLAVCFEHGIGTTVDFKQAFKYYQLAAESGSAKAQENLGHCYARGVGVAQDYSRAVHFFRLAADQGLPTAQYSLGLCYSGGFGVREDSKTGLYYIELAAKQGLSQAEEVANQIRRYNYRPKKSDYDEALEQRRVHYLTTGQ